MIRCTPGHKCENQKTYFRTDFSRPNQFKSLRSAKEEAEVEEREDGGEFTRPQSNTKQDQHSSHFGMRLSRPLRPTIDTLSHEQISKAKMVRASRIAYEKDYAAAQKFLDDNAIAYDIDERLSTKESLVLHSENDVKVAYRGTKWGSAADITLDAAIAVGVEEHHPNMKSSEHQLLRVTEKYGAPSELVGFSLGGGKALSLGEKFSISTTVFNPFIGKSLIQGSNVGSETHHIIRTTEDPVSLGIGLKRGQKNWKVESILPHHDKLNIAEAHRLSNFTDSSERRAGHTETMLKDVHLQGQKAGELEMLDSIKTSQENGKSFTEWLHDFNNKSGQDTNSEGTRLSGSRMHRNSRHVKAWDQAKNIGSSQKPFTTDELAHFDSVGEKNASYSDAHSKQTREKFLSKSPAERRVAINEAHEKLAKVAEVANTHTEMHTATSNLIKRAIHPTSLSTGLGAGIAASILVNQIDPNHQINEPARLLGEGAISGVGAELGMAALAGTVVSAGTLGIAGVAGGASYIAGAGAGSLTTHLMENAHVDENVSEAVGSSVGGAVGGGVAAGVGILGAMATGAEIGSFGGPVGLAVGAGVGTIVGLAGWGFGKLFGGH